MFVCWVCFVVALFTQRLICSHAVFISIDNCISFIRAIICLFYYFFLLCSRICLFIFFKSFTYLFIFLCVCSFDFVCLFIYSIRLYATCNIAHNDIKSFSRSVNNSTSVQFSVLLSIISLRSCFLFWLLLMVVVVLFGFILVISMSALSFLHYICLPFPDPFKVIIWRRLGLYSDMVSQSSCHVVNTRVFLGVTPLSCPPDGRSRGQGTLTQF